MIYMRIFKKMIINTDVGFGIIESMESLWERQELLDFTVQVENREIKCHRFILGACSTVFSAIFRSGTKEYQNGLAVIEGVSQGTFEDILRALYTGSDVVKQENVIAMWHATSLLQIDLMVRHCENKVVEWLTIENFENISANAKILNSKRVKEGVFNFMLKNFEIVRNTRTFFEMTSSELLEFIDSYKLVVSSEDLVLESIFKWVEYSPESIQDLNVKSLIDKSSSILTNVKNIIVKISNSNEEEMICKHYPEELAEAHAQISDISNNSVKGSAGDIQNYDVKNVVLHIKQETETKRLEILTTLIKVSRTCLLSRGCHQWLYKNSLCNSLPEVRELLISAAMYHYDVQGYLPRAATHRIGSLIENVAVFASDKEMTVYSMERNESFKLPLGPNTAIRSMTFLSYSNEIYAFGLNSDIRVFRDNSWVSILKLNNSSPFIINHDRYFFHVNLANKRIDRYNPKNSDENKSGFVVLPDNVTNVKLWFSFNKRIMLFCNEFNKSTHKKETDVHSLDVSSKTWTRLGNFKELVTQAISFNDDKTTYILQETGHMWVVLERAFDVISFECLGQMWVKPKSLKSAVINNRELILFGCDITDDLPDITKLSDPPESFDKIRWYRDNVYSNVILATIQKKYISK